jgi:hypothetical protein
MNGRRIAAVGSALTIAATTPVAASAAGSLPADKQYDNPITQTTTTGGGVADNGRDVAAVTPQGNDLPFTGFDAGLTVAGGLALVGLGLGLRRFGRRSDR